MLKRDIAYRNKVLRRQVSDQSLPIRQWLFLRVNRPLKQQINKMTHVTEEDILLLVSNLIDTDDKKIEAIRRKHDRIKAYGTKVLKELKRLKRKYGEKD